VREARANKPKLTLDQAADLLDRNRAGESQRKLAVEVGVAGSVLGDWLKKAAEEEARANARRLPDIAVVRSLAF
jgi:hypothetical protein